MEINTEKLRLCSCRVVREAKAQQSVDCDITLPDYCCDIKSVLSCEVEPGITGIDVVGNRITAMGNAVIRLVYTGENNKVSCFEQNYPISKYVEMSALSPESAVLVKAKVNYVNCRAVSPRRVDVHGCIDILFSVVACEETEIVRSAAAQGLQLRQLPMKVHNCVGCTAKLFQMSEVVPLPESVGKVRGIVRSSALPVVTQIKAVSDKILIKGELRINLTLCADDGVINGFEHSMPMSQIVELQGIDENSLCDVRLSSCALDVRLKTDDSGESSQLDAAASINAFLRGYNELAFAGIEDAYCLGANLESDCVSVTEQSLLQQLNETFVVSSELDFSGAAAGKVLEAHCEDLTCVCGYDNGELDLSGGVTVCVLYEDKEAKPCYVKRRVDYRHSKQLGQAQDICCEPDVCVSAVSVTGSGNTLSAKVQLTAGGCVFGCEKKTVLSDMHLIPDEAQASRCAITVYFSDKGEKLWDIAKRFNTSVEAVGRRNSLSSDCVEENTMLIIPGA